MSYDEQFHINGEIPVLAAARAEGEPFSCIDEVNGVVDIGSPKTGIGWPIIVYAFVAFFVALIALFLLTSPDFADADPADAVPPNPDGTVAMQGKNTSSATRSPDDNKTGIEDDEKVRDENGRVSQLSTDTHNPYNGQIRLDIDMGSEFADYDGCEFSEGIRIKASPGSTVTLPRLRARDGYYFVGWGQGGVPEEPTWAPDVTEVELDSDTSDGKTATIFALYADDEGNGYCTCGAYEAGIYADKLDEIKAANAAYNEATGLFPGLARFKDIVAAALGGLASICALALLVFWYARRTRRKDEQAAMQAQVGETEEMHS